MYKFTESQRFNQWWLWLILIAVPISVVYKAWGKLATGTPNIIAVVLFSVVVPILVLCLFVAMRLKTTIDDAGVSYVFFPFGLKQTTRSWNEIEHAYVRQYSPIGEFGGWGIRYSFGNGRALNVAGNMGLQLVFKTGKKLLIGTQKPEEIKEVLAQLARQRIIPATVIQEPAE